jgi:hypothetical protein
VHLLDAPDERHKIPHPQLAPYGFVSTGHDLAYGSILRSLDLPA